MDDVDQVIIIDGIGPGSMSQEPLALVAKMSDSERRALESDGRGGLAIAAELVTSPEIQYRTSIQHFLTFPFLRNFRVLSDLHRGRGYFLEDSRYSW